jgi:hypothetical protein
MSIHLTREQQDRLRDRTIPPAEAAQVGQHAAECESCQKTLLELVSSDRSVRDLRTLFEAEEVEHVTPQLLTSYVDRTLPENELEPVRLHLQDCADCTAELDELRMLKARLAPRRRWRAPLAAGVFIAAGVSGLLWFVIGKQAASPSPQVRISGKPNPRHPVSTAAHYERADWTKWVDEARESRSFPVPAIVEALQPRRATLRGAAPETDLHMQPDRVVVEEIRPLFQWTKEDGVTWRVIVTIDGGIVESEMLHEPHWTPPFDLRRGGDYAWQLEVSAGSRRTIYPRAPAPPARFRILEQSAADEIDEARRLHPGDDLLLAVILARHGLQNETLTALGRLAQSDPRLADALRQSIARWP